VQGDLTAADRVGIDPDKLNVVNRGSISMATLHRHDRVFAAGRKRLANEMVRAKSGDCCCGHGL